MIMKIDPIKSFIIGNAHTKMESINKVVVKRMMINIIRRSKSSIGKDHKIIRIFVEREIMIMMIGVI